MNKAAVDCGTNSTRLLITDVQGDRVVEELRLTRLGEGVHASRRLLPEAIERTCQALRDFHELTVRHDVGEIRAVTTSAVRDAGNSDEFLAAAGEALGHPIEVISGDQEAALTFSGATSGRPGDKWHLVVDIGGGSTEMVLGRGVEVAFVKSFDLGCVRLTEQYLAGDPPTEEQLAKASDAVATEIEASGLRALVVEHSPDMIAVAGTATSLAGVDLGLDSFESDRVDGHELSLEAVQRIHDDLRSKTSIDRSSPLIPLARSEVILGGTIVLLTAMHKLGLGNCRTSVSDLLVGIVEELGPRPDDR